MHFTVLALAKGSAHYTIYSCSTHAVAFLFRTLAGLDISSSWLLSILLIVHLYLSPLLRDPAAAGWNLLTRDEPGDRPLHNELADIITEADFAVIYSYTLTTLFFSGAIVRFIWHHVLILTSMLAAFPVLLILLAFTWLRFTPGAYQQHYETGGIFEAVFAMFMTGLSFMSTTRLEVILGTIHFQHEWFADKPPTLTPNEKMLFETTRSEDQFTYEYLDTRSKHFRLLRSTKQTLLSKPSFELITVPISRAPPYEAISYTWGDQREDRFLELSGNRWIRVTENVIKIAFQRASWKEARHIWIDAICINQSNDIEKSHQVQLMGEIYGNAKRVLVWLDDSLQKAGDAMRLLSHMHFLKYTANDPVNIIPTSPHHHWSAYINFFSHSYWSRTWIIQEIALGRVVHLFYGYQFISINHVWDELDLRHESTKLRISFYMSNQGLDYMPVIEGANRFSTIHFCRRRMLANDLLPLGESLSIVHEFEAKCKSDKVFGVNALVVGPERMLPDYQLAAHQVYLRVAHMLLDLDPQTLFERAGLCFPRPIQNLPSWVPDWSLMSRDTYESRISYARNSSSYRAGGPRRPQITHAERFETQISLEVVALSTIKRIGPSWPVVANLPPPEEILTLRNLFWESARFFATAIQPRDFEEALQLPDEAVWRTMIGDRERDAPLAVFPASPYHGEAFRSVYGSILNELAGRAPVMMEELTPEENGNIRKYFLNMSNALTGRKLAITNDGTMMITPPCTQVDDQLVVVPGMALPVLLRQKHHLDAEVRSVENWKLVGCCYAYGFMQGEALVRPRVRMTII